jgi:hypothetical protein
MSQAFKIVFIRSTLIAVSSLVFSVAFAGKKENVIRWAEGNKNCQGIQVPAVVDGTFCESLAYLKAHISPLKNTTSIFKNAPVVFLGDTHPNVLIKKWLIRNLAQLKADGFTHVALEALNSESQGLIDGYSKNSALRPQVLQLIAADWGWIPEAHVQLIDAVLAAGLKLVAIDNRNELDRKGLGNDIQLRNNHMAEQLENSLQEKGAGRVIVLTGKLHSALVSDEPNISTLPGVLGNNGIQSLSFSLESGEEPVPRNITQAFFQELRQNSLAASPQGDYFLPTANSPEADAILFISR